MPVDSRTVIFALLYERWERKWDCLSAMSFLFSLLTYYGRCRVDRKFVNWKLAHIALYIYKFTEMQTQFLYLGTVVVSFEEFMSLKDKRLEIL